MPTSRRHRRAYALLLSLALVAIAAAPVSAAKAPKTTVCHLDRTLGAYTLTVISASSLAKHLGHGDGIPGEGLLDENCQPVVAERVFARAWTDQNGNHAYDEADDVLIAELVDTNRDNVANAGDTVRTNAFPVSLSLPTAYGTFGVTTHTVASVGSLESGATTIIDADGWRYLFVRYEAREIYEESRGPLITVFQDGFLSETLDAAVTEATSSSPDPSTVYTMLTRPGDDPFVDVWTDFPG